MRAALRPSRRGALGRQGLAGAARSRPRERGCSAPSGGSRRWFSLRSAEHESSVLCAGEWESNRSQSTATVRDPRSATSPRRAPNSRPSLTFARSSAADGRPRSAQHGLGPRPGGGYGCARRTPGHAPRRGPAWGRSAGALGPRIAAAI